jgi:predicted amidohydrolase YtcJ
VVRTKCSTSIPHTRRGWRSTGKLADPAVLDKPFLTIHEGQIPTIKSLLTLVGGKVVWSEPPFGSAR